MKVIKFTTGFNPNQFNRICYPSGPNAPESVKHTLPKRLGGKLPVTKIPCSACNAVEDIWLKLLFSTLTKSLAFEFVYWHSGGKHINSQ